MEPFAGSAAYSCRYFKNKVWLNDIDPVIFSVWKYLLSPLTTPEEILALPDIETTVDDYDLTQEQKWLIGFWLNRGVSAPCKSMSKWGRQNPRKAFMWSDLVRQRLASQIHNIKHWEVTNCSFENLPAFEATWFIDPPYQVAGKHYKFSKIDFSLLSAFSKDRKGQTIVCENEGADWLPFSPLCNQFSSLKKQTKEAVWVS